MLIRRPVDEVFEAFIDPAITTRFWFSKGSGRLEPNVWVRWDWEMYGASAEVLVKAIEPNRRILIDWGRPGDMTEVEWRFDARGANTFVTVENRGFPDSPEGVGKALDSNGGFNLVMAAAKIWLEHGIDPRIVPDRHPDHRAPGWEEPS